MTAEQQREAKRRDAVELREWGLSLRSVHAQLGCDPKYTRKWSATAAETGDVKRKPYSQRARPALTPRAKQAAESLLVEQQGASTRKTADRLTQRGMPISHVTVWRFARQRLRVHPYHRPLAVTITDAQKKTRLQWARAHVRDGAGYWRRVVFSDEKTWTLQALRNPKTDIYWARSKNRVPALRRRQGAETLTCWGAVSWSGRSRLHFFPRGQTQTGQYYREQVLKRGLLPDLPRLAANRQRMIFQQDHHTSHTARATTALLEAKLPGRFLSKEEWVPKDVDLNLIENVWGAMTTRLAGRDFHTREGLKRAVRRAWEAVAQEEIQNMYDSMPARVAAVVRQRGDQAPTK